MNKSLLILFLLATAVYCRTFSANPPKDKVGAALHLQGGKNAPDFDLRKPVGRSALEDDDDPYTDDPSTDDPSTDHEDPGTGPITDYSDDGRPELETRSARLGGGKAPDFDITKRVGRGARFDEDGEDDGEDDIPAEDGVDDERPSDDDGEGDHEFEARKTRSFGGGKAPDFDMSKRVGRGARSDEDGEDDGEDDIPAEDDGGEDDRREFEVRKTRSVGGGKALNFNARKPVGRGANSDYVDDDGGLDDIPSDDSRTDGEDDGGGDDGHELEARNLGRWQKA